MPISTINNKSIADGTVIAADILDGTISSSKLVSANIAGDRIAANTLSNTVFQTGSVESYLRGANLDFGMRNKIINGAMVIDQRNGGASGTATGYTVDRWTYLASQSAKGTWQQNAGSVTPPAGFSNYLGFTSSSSYSVTSSDYFAFYQSIEGFNFADLAFGTASARPVTISFWVRSSLTGTFGGAFNNYANNRCYPFTYTITSANTWEQKRITIAGDTSGTWVGASNAGAASLILGLGAGSNRSATAGAWATPGGDAPFTATGATSVVGTNAATWYVTGVQLEEGSVPTAFEYRHYGTELALCQRYFYKMSGGSQYIRIGTGPANETTAALITVFMQTPMRATPSSLTQTGSLGLWTGSTVFSVSATAVIGDSSSPFTAVVSATSTGLTVGTTYQLIGNNSATASIGLSAEL